MAQKKISFIELEQLVREGNNVSQIAQKLGVTKGAVSKALKKLNVAINKDLALRSAPEVVDRNIDAIDQLQKINDYANELLDLLMRMKDPRELALKAMAEIRGQLNLQLELFKCLYDIEAVKQFQEEVLGAINEVSPEVRDRILHKLTERRAIRSTIDFPGRIP